MAHNTLVRSPVTSWTNGSTVLTSEVTTIDLNLTQGINGVDGSTHAPTSVITIGGSGLSLGLPGQPWVNATTYAAGALVVPASPAPAWATSTAYPLNSYVVPTLDNRLYYKATAISGTGTSSPTTQPTWPTTIGTPVTDNPGANQIIWTCFANILNGNYYMALTAGTSAATLAGQPTLNGGWPTAIGSTVVDGTIQWVCRGLPPPTCVVSKSATLIDSTGGWSHQDYDFPQLGPLHSGRNKAIMYPFVGGTPGFAGGWRTRYRDGGVQSVAPIIDQSDGRGPQPQTFSAPFRARNGATLTLVTVNFRVSTPHTQVPGSTPAARVVRIDAFGNRVPMSSAATGADANGYIYFPRPSSPQAWYARAATQQLNVVCDTANVIDVSQYTYAVDIIEENGISPGYPFNIQFLKPCKAAGFQSKLNGAEATVDGLSMNVDDRILVFGGTTATFNSPWATGVWTWKTGDWARSSDLKASSQFVVGMVIPVSAGGAAFGGNYWQVMSTQKSWTTAPTSIAGDLKAWTASTAYGVGMYAAPQLGSQNGYFYQATAVTGAHTSGLSQPNWPKGIGQTVIDNPVADQITWTCSGSFQADTLNLVARGPFDDEIVAGSAFYAHGTCFQAFGALYTNITQADFE